MKLYIEGDIYFIPKFHILETGTVKLSIETDLNKALDDNTPLAAAGPTSSPLQSPNRIDRYMHEYYSPCMTLVSASGRSAYMLLLILAWSLCLAQINGHCSVRAAHKVKTKLITVP
jgi:hypothetical protein